MDIQQFYRSLDENYIFDSSDTDMLKSIVDEYPYFQIATFTYLKALYQKGSDDFENELKRISIFINDRKALFYYIFSAEYKHFFEQTGKKNITKDKTDVLLNAFFETHQTPESDTELEYNITHSTMASSDYFTYINAILTTDSTGDIPPFCKDKIPLKHQDIIDSFIEKSEKDGGIRIEINNNEKNCPAKAVPENIGTDDELDEDMFFTETLAKIYIKQKKYEKAYKIIKHLSLNYPKKNIYFADQLSFLEKLIINSKFKDQK